MGVMDLRRNILLNEPHIATVTGNPVSVKTDIKGKLKLFKASFTPIQSGTGDPSPSNVRPITGWTGVNVTRCGKNLFDYSTCVFENGFRDDNGDVSSSTTSKYTTSVLRVKPSTKYVWYGTLRKGGYAVRVYYLDVNKNWISRSSGYNADLIPFTTPSNCAFIQLQTTQTVSDPTTWMVEEGETEGTFEAYTGQSYPVTFPALGKNLFNPNAEFNTVNTRASTFVVPEAETANMSFTLKDSTIDLSGIYFGFMYNPSNINDGYVWCMNNGTIVNYKKNETSNKYCQYVTYYPNNPETLAKILQAYDVQVELGSTATSYEPYTNTVYGGYVDLIAGELVVEWIGYKIKDLKWTYQSTQTRFRCQLTNLVDNTGSASGWGSVAIAEIYKSASALSSDRIATYSDNYIYIRDERYTDADDFVEAVGETTIAYPLKNPITYQLTPQQIKSLVGDNTIWSDANGNLEIKLWKH